MFDSDGATLFATLPQLPLRHVLATCSLPCGSYERLLDLLVASETIASAWRHAAQCPYPLGVGPLFVRHVISQMQRRGQARLLRGKASLVECVHADDMTSSHVAESVTFVWRYVSRTTIEFERAQKQRAFVSARWKPQMEPCSMSLPLNPIESGCTLMNLRTRIAGSNT